jgi:CRP-like cAMP-binding protein
MPLMRTKKADVLESIELFRACTKKELDEISRITYDTEVPEGAVLCVEGDKGLEFFIIVDGRALVTRRGVEICELGPGQFFGEMALLDGGPRVAEVRAITPMRVLVLSRQEFEQLLEQVPRVSRRILTAMGGRLRHVDRRLFGI